MNLLNKTYVFTNTNMRPVKQQGVVLFFALIALVVMSLAAVGLIRSVDTGTIIAGNLASKQSAIASADGGMETALTWMEGLASPTTLESDGAAQGYYATQALNPATLLWNSSDSLPADDVSGGIDANGKDLSGNTVRYVIQRMCRATGPSTPEGCLFGAPQVGTGSKGVLDAPRGGAGLSLEQSPLYRVTARVVGVKNTISYIQVFVY